MADLNKLLNSLKGISGTGNTLSQVMKLRDDFIGTMEPGDYANNRSKKATAAPIAYDLWYLFGHDNFLSHYYVDDDGESTLAGSYFDFTDYIAENMQFLQYLPGLKPMKIMRGMEQLVGYAETDLYGFYERTAWANNGVYWINTIAFELWTKDIGMQYASDGPTKDFKINDYVGYISFPVGQLGVMEVISLMTETGISGYQFASTEEGVDFWVKPSVSLEAKDTPIAISSPEIFPPAKDDNGNMLANQGYCYGRHLIEKGYLVSETPVPSQNQHNSEGSTPYAPVAKNDLELIASPMVAYMTDVKPKKWMRYWIHKDSVWPVPGEFIGILCRPVTVPPHVWWFQESIPLLYAGNWMETGNLTSGVVTSVTLEEDREDEGIGNEYKVKIQGCEVTIYSSDFFLYTVGDRVAILKVDSAAAKQEKSFTWNDQLTLAFDQTDKGMIITNYIIIPATFYKIVC